MNETRPVRFCGVYRSDEFGVVQLEDAGLMGCVLRNAWKKDYYGKGVPEGTLAHACYCRTDEKRWKVAIERLENYGYVTVDGGMRSDRAYIKITDVGKYWATELCLDRQAAGKTQEGVEV